MEREFDLQKVVDGLDETSRKVVAPVVTDILFIEKQLDELRKLPFISVNPRNPVQQRITPAAKQYKELMQTYAGLLKLLLGSMPNGDGAETSPLREYLNSLKER